MEGIRKEWFSEWFNSPYYHILYKHRDFDEAKLFINKLSDFLQFKKGDKILDAACGRGRHAIYLCEKGMNATGIDLSEESIKYASKFESPNLHFFVHDMRENFRKAEFEYILNLFTSFGYFENEEDNYKTIAAFAQGLKTGGTLVIDFMNPERIIRGLVPIETTEVEGIKFTISRRVEGNFIIKDISFKTDEKQHYYYEKVKIIHRDDFSNYFNFAQLSLQGVFGDYQLNKYDESESERMIFIAKKN